MQAVSTCGPPTFSDAPFLSTGLIQMCGSQHFVRILRDTCALISLWVKPAFVDVDSVDHILIWGVTWSMSVLLVVFNLSKSLARVRFVDCLPVSGIDFTLDNDLMKAEEITVTHSCSTFRSGR